ncbi:MAG: glycosyltransferase [Bryobacteraceae bacterium]
MKISLVTISFNQAPFLDQAIRSVVDQTGCDFEYIVVDPGSIDGSREIIESYSDRISRIIFAPDRGAADGLNKGFAEAHGEIFGFLNSDDVLEGVGRVTEYFGTHPDTDVVSGHSRIIDANGNVNVFFLDAIL